MPGRDRRLSLFAQVAAALAATALFASSVAGLVSLDGALEEAVNAEQRSVPVSVKTDRGDRDCPWDRHHRLRMRSPS